MNTVTRRSMITGSAVALAAGAIPAVAAPAVAKGLAGAGENPRLLALAAELDSANADLTKAREDLQWLADEWRHLWPLAPEEILGGANAHHFGGTMNRDAERDITGAYLMRDTAPLTKRLSNDFRRENEQTCFSVITSQEAEDHLARWRAIEPKGRTPKALAMRIRHRAKMIEQSQVEERLARQYEAETARLRELSGVEDVKSRIKELEKRKSATSDALIAEPAWTVEGVAVKARAHLARIGVFPSGIWPMDSMRLVLRDVLALDAA